MVGHLVSWHWGSAEKLSIENLVNVRSHVTADGDEALIRLELRGGNAIHVRLDAEQMLNIYHEIWHAAATVIKRQKMRADRGESFMKGASLTALEPVNCRFSIEPDTGNLIAFHSFLDHAPVIMTLAPMAVLENLAAIGDVLRRSRN